MTYKIAMVAQKGGVGKSTLARIIAVEAARGGLQTKIADLDTQQTTKRQLGRETGGKRLGAADTR